jgi:hypothetical protein
MYSSPLEPHFFFNLFWAWLGRQMLTSKSLFTFPAKNNEIILQIGIFGSVAWLGVWSCDVFCGYSGFFKLSQTVEIEIAETSSYGHTAF